MVLVIRSIQRVEAEVFGIPGSRGKGSRKTRCEKQNKN
jgi:hypothetical protein